MDIVSIIVLVEEHYMSTNIKVKMSVKGQKAQICTEMRAKNEREIRRSQV